MLQALTRRSALNEGRQESSIGDFQRLEFIGDRVLDMVISDILFDNYPDWNEGQLTQELSRFTNNSGPLYAVAKRLKLGEFLILGSGEEQINLRNNVKALSDALEALVGAIWVDSDRDYKFMKKFIREQFGILRLIDFNEEYKEKTVEIASKKMFFDIMDDMVPELAEFGFGSRGMTGSELIAYQRMKIKATKPLTGLAASCEKYLDSPEDSDNSGEEGKEEESDDKDRVFSQLCSASLSQSSSSRFFSSTGSSSTPLHILKTRDDLTFAERKLQTCLTQACYDADIDTVKRLIEEGAYPTKADENGQEPMAAAIWGLALEVVVYLETKANYSYQDWKRIANNVLSLRGHVLPFGSSIKSYADLLQHYRGEEDRWFYSYTDLWCRVVMHNRVQKTQLSPRGDYDELQLTEDKIIYKIVKERKGPFMKLRRPDNPKIEHWEYDTPLWLVREISKTIAKLLRARGVALTEDYLLEDQNWQGLKLPNRLVKACSDADVEMVKILVEYEGAEPRQPDENGLEPLAAAIWALSFGVIRYLETKLNYTAEEWERIASTLLSKYGRILPFSSPIITYSDLLQHYQAQAQDTLWFYDYHSFSKRIAQYNVGENFQPHRGHHQTLGYTYDSIEYEPKTGWYKIKINNTNHLSFQGEEVKLVKHEYVVDPYTVEAWGGKMNVSHDAPTKVVMTLCDAMAQILKEHGVSLSQNYEVTNQSSLGLKPR